MKRKWGNIGAPKSAKRRRHLASIRRKRPRKRRRRSKTKRWF